MRRGACACWLASALLACAAATAPPTQSAQSVADDDAVVRLERQVLGIACQRGDWRQVLLHMQISADASEERTLTERFNEIATDLARAHRGEGQPEAALEVATYGLDFATRRELGELAIARWRELRLGILYATGRYQDVLDEMDSVLRTYDDAGDSVSLAPVREATLHHGAGAAKALQRWQLALDLNRAIVDSLEARGVTETTRAAQRMLDYAGLLELGDSDASDALLRECQTLFESGDEPASLAYVLAARGVVAGRKGDARVAVEFKRRSLEARYRAPADLGALGHAHQIYANELCRLGESPERIGLHWLAAAVLYALVGDRNVSAALCAQVAATQRATTLALPATPEALTRSVAEDGFPFELGLRATDQRRASAVVTDILNNLRT
jgi:tetratricopeptide (TPR) repeat protein